MDTFLAENWKTLLDYTFLVFIVYMSSYYLLPTCQRLLADADDDIAVSNTKKVRFQLGGMQARDELTRAQTHHRQDKPSKGFEEPDPGRTTALKDNVQNPPSILKKQSSPTPEEEASSQQKGQPQREQDKKEHCLFATFSTMEEPQLLVKSMKLTSGDSGSVYIKCAFEIEIPMSKGRPLGVQI
ncbi:hypothetical protein GGR55DRAFT_651912, partial [Xylaria sp. FL0064]